MNSAHMPGQPQWGVHNPAPAASPAAPAFAQAPVPSPGPSLVEQYAALQEQNATGLMLLSIAAIRHEHRCTDTASPVHSDYPGSPFPHDADDADASSADEEYYIDEGETDNDGCPDEEDELPEEDEPTRLMTRRFSQISVVHRPMVSAPFQAAFAQPFAPQHAQQQRQGLGGARPLGGGQASSFAPIRQRPASPSPASPRPSTPSPETASIGPSKKKPALWASNPTTEKYKCRFCSKEFARVADVKRHEGVHSNEKPFGCSFCDKSFRLRSTLKMHERTHTGEKPYACECCDRCFSQSSSLNRHRRSCHPEAAAARRLKKKALAAQHGHGHGHGLGVVAAAAAAAGVASHGASSATSAISG